MKFQKIKLFKDARYHRNLIFLSPILFILFFIPMVLYVKRIDVPEYIVNMWTGSKVYYDLFCCYKSYFLIGASLIAIILLLIRFKTEDFYLRKTNLYYIPVIIYTALVIISTVTSEYTNISMVGFIDRFEGAVVLVSYMMILFVSINFFCNEADINIALKFLFISSAILGIYGIFQFLNLDPIINTQIGKKFIIPYKLNEIKSITAAQKDIICMTFFNPNYVGSYTAMLFPVSLVMFLSSNKKNLQVLFGIYSCIIFANWTGCLSRAGILGGTAAAVLAIFLLRRNIKSYIKKFLIIIPCYIIIFLLMNIYSGNNLLFKFNNFNPENEAKTMESSKANIEDIKIDKSKVSIITSTETLIVEFKKKNMFLYDASNAPLKYYTDVSEKTFIDDPKYKRYTINYNKDKPVINFKIDNMTIDLYNDGTNVGIVSLRGNAYSTFDHPEHIGFAGHETFASSRGYIWSRTLPMLKNTILKGYGPDTYIFYFPQYDFVGKINAFHTSNIIVDKPHNMYLQIAVNTGVISLIALLILFGAYLFKSMKIYSHINDFNSLNYKGVALFAAVTGYLIAALFNDSVVSVAPVFWIILGLGISCNFIKMEKA